MSEKELLVAYQWQKEMGADEAIAAEPEKENILAMPKPAEAPENTPTQATPTTASTPSVSKSTNPLTQSKQLAEAATTLEELKQAVLGFEGCALKKMATNTVFADGNPESDIMFIGEAPGAQEDVEGIPFCGQSGQLLDHMLSLAGIIRAENFYITNTLFWRPPGNRKPTPEEIEICRPFVEKHIALFKPKLLVLVGGTAIASVLQSKQGITKMRGVFSEYSNEFTEEKTLVTAVFHPSYLLRSPGQKKYMWQDLLAIREKCEALGITLGDWPWA